MRKGKSHFAGLVLLGCCLFSVSLFAQDYRPGYIIKINGDSIHGLVSYMPGKNESRCDFKSAKGSKRISYFPSDLLSYGFSDDPKYVSLTLPGKEAPNDKVFVRILSEGPLMLYRHDKTFFVKKDDLIELPIPKGKIVDPVETGGNKMEKRDTRYIGILNLLLADCQLKADEASYSETDLTRVVNNYNRCKNFPVKEIKLKPIYRANVGLLSGYVFSDLTLKESAVVPFSSTDMDFDRSKTIIGGVSLDISSPRINDRLFLTVEGWYFKSTYIGRDYSNDMVYQDITMDISSIRMFLGFRYNFLQESSTPFLKAGISGTITQDLSLKSIKETEDNVDQVFYDDELSGTYFQKKIRGYWFAAGYDRLIVGKMKGFVEFRFERADAYFGTALTPDSKLNNISLLVGIRF